MPDLIDVIRAANTRRAKCCDTVAAWLEANGVAAGIPQRERFRLWRRGVADGARIAAARIGLAEIDTLERRDGDVVLVLQPGGVETLGVARGDWCIIASKGVVGALRVEPIACWALPCHR